MVIREHLENQKVEKKITCSPPSQLSSLVIDISAVFSFRCIV